MNSRALAGAVALAAGIFACVFSAQAADLPAAPRLPPQAPAAFAPQVYDWSGFYVGGHIGGGFADSSWSDPFTGSDNFHKGGFLGGGQVGYNSQFNWLVLGLEGDFSWTGLKSHGTDSLGDALTTNTQWTSTVTGRVGAAFDRLLVYGKGGLAIAHDQSSSLTDVALNTSSTTLTRTGWTAGAGLEYALNRNWTVRLEYDYLGFGAKALNFTTPVLGAVTSNADLNVQEIKAGLNFKFGN